MKRKRVLVAPLEWGLGHATRCVPLIRELNRQNAEVILAADGRAHQFLGQEFPDMPLLRFPGYGITYPASSRLAFHLAVRAPLILGRIRQERKTLSFPTIVSPAGAKKPITFTSATSFV
jgi:UDP:flavonoid glycosyltransferase YjiC (YdhE family)